MLVVEDDPHVRSALEAGLAFAGYEIVSATDGQEALELLASQRPALILLDLGLPKLSGAAVAEELRCHDHVSSIPMILLSADPDLPDVASQVGADAYFSKPVRLTAILREVARLAEG